MADGRYFKLQHHFRQFSLVHRRALQQWLDTQGGNIQAADPVPEPARVEKIRRDPAYPSAEEFMEAQFHCRYDLDCSALDNLYSRMKRLESQYP